MADNDVDTTFAELAAVVNDIVREMRVRSAAGGPAYRLTQNQSQIMSCVHSAPGSTPSQIAERTGLRRANVSTALKELRADGYIESVADRSDGRVVRVYATARADRTLAMLRSGWADVLASAWAGEAAELAQATGMLMRLRDGLTDTPPRSASTDPAAVALDTSVTVR